MTFREIEQFALESSLVLFVVDNFRLHRFFPQKNTTKKLIFLSLIFTDMNSSQKEINVPFWCKKESRFDRCMYRGFLFLLIFTVFEKLVFYGYHM